MAKHLDLKDKWVFITGASSGLGYEFARQFAMEGANLLLNARSIETLRTMKIDLEKEFANHVEIAPVDLSEPEAPHLIIEYIKQHMIAVDVLVNNAGFGYFDLFYNMDQDDIRRMNNVNMSSLADLTNIFMQGMIKRGEGGILNVASLAAFQPLPHAANYAATKAYVFSLTSALHQEVNKKGVHVSCLAPGPVKTNFFNAAGINTNNYGKMADPKSVVAQAIKGLKKNKVLVIPREQRAGLYLLGPLMPTKAKLVLIEKLYGGK